MTAVQWKPPSKLVRGFVSFTIAGSVETTRGFEKQIVNAAKDDNAVVVCLHPESRILGVPISD
jgi:hypothetical protein